MAPKVKQNKSDGNSVKTKSKKSTKQEKEAQSNALEHELRMKIAKLEGENVLLHEKNLDVTVSFIIERVRRGFKSFFFIFRKNWLIPRRI